MCTLQTQIGHSNEEQGKRKYTHNNFLFVYLGGGPVAGVHEHAVADIRQN